MPGSAQTRISPASGIRNTGLDGLRGIAALSVALGHCVLRITGLPLWGTSLRDFPTMPWTDIGMRVLSALFPSDAAVMVFFVLSGHVLWGSYQRKNLQFLRDLPDYVCARVYRLFPLVIVSGLPLGLLTDAPARELVSNMLLLSASLNGVLWSLQVEVVASFALFALWGLTRGSAWKLLLGLIAAFGATPFFHGQILVLFFPAFIMGASIGSLPPRLFRQWWMIVIGLVCLIFASLMLGRSGITRCLEMAGAMIVVGAVANARLGFLRGRLPRFLGAISYPFYLTHIVGTLIAEPYLYGLATAAPLVRIAALAVTSIAVTIPLAWLLHVVVENPILRARPRIISR
jgi:peptidoglycan/LPS O-acetylase OafA/YrhL